MAKKVVFLLVFMMMLALASVTAFAAGTNETEAGLTQDETVAITVVNPEEKKINYEEEYADLFFNPDLVSEESFLLDVVYKRDFSTNSQLRYKFTGTVVDGSVDSTVVMMMYIKVDGEYRPLYCVDTKQGELTNAVEGTFVFYTKAELLNLGSDKVNEVRFVIFKKGEEKLELGVNLQITDMLIVVKNLTPIERVKIEFTQFIQALPPYSS
jgi:hypothetical protein